uniref:Failed axon connections homolog n=1 Tax=Saccoglossus kowalevskii TaxID=10224 RepID=A0ABM0GPV3_SACKO|nr:PREDICTED: failed axon connections homolog [Saccoglossus kowalevskii]
MAIVSWAWDTWDRSHHNTSLAIGGVAAAATISVIVYKHLRDSRLMTLLSVHSLRLSRSHRTPWIEYNGEVVSDSGFIIEFLNERLKVNLNSHLDATEKAIARAFREMVEENLCWTLAYIKWLDKTPSNLLTTIYPQRTVVIWLMRKAIEPVMKKTLYLQGIGRHTRQEVFSRVEKDFLALSAFLGNKAYMFGNKPSEEDCSIFAVLAQFTWNLPGTNIETFIKGDCKNLEEYCYRMKERFWPDWEQCIMGDQKSAWFEFVSYPMTDPTLLRG